MNTAKDSEKKIEIACKEHPEIGKEFTGIVTVTINLFKGGLRHLKAEKIIK